MRLWYRGAKTSLRQCINSYTRAAHPDHTAVLADLDPELDGLPLSIPAGIPGKVKNMGRLRSGQIPGTRISVCRGVGGMFAAGGAIIMSNKFHRAGVSLIWAAGSTCSRVGRCQ
jgi:hypothetical protein